MSRATSTYIDLEEAETCSHLSSSTPISVLHCSSSREIRRASLDAEPTVRTGAEIVVREGCANGDLMGVSEGGGGGLSASQDLCPSWRIIRVLSLLGRTNTPLARKGRARHPGDEVTCGLAQFRHLIGVRHGPLWKSGAQSPQRAWRVQALIL